MSLNHIYKVVWSKTKGCYIVVSELAKRVGRNKAKAIVISSAAMAMAGESSDDKYSQCDYKSGRHRGK